MKQVYIIGDKLFSNDVELINFLSTLESKKHDISKIDIEKVELNIIESVDGDSFLKSYISRNSRDLKLSAVMGDEFSANVEKFKSMFSELAVDNVLKERFSSKLKTTGLNKKSFSKLLTDNVGYLFSVITTVEWYSIILSIHNFRKIEDFYYRELVSSNGVPRLANVKVNEEAKSNFKLSKSK